MTNADRMLIRLARLAGVAPSYRDAWRRLRRVQPETLRALLGAMGLAVDSPADIETSCAILQSAEWDAPLTPVATTVAGPAALVPVTIGDGDRAHWRLRLETGETREGVAELDALTVLAERRERRRRRRRLALPIEASVPPGYHWLSLSLGDIEAEALLIVAPRRCHLPPALAEGARSWALTAQLYALRSAHNWGIGDFTDLGVLGSAAARQGAGALGINPLHALFPGEPRHVSPYSPSSRLFLNPLYLDATAVPDFAGQAPAGELAAARAGALVDYPRVAALKRPVLEACYRRFAERHLGAASSERGEAFRRFQREGGRSLESFALFSALHEHMLVERGGFCWQDWPVALRNAGSAEVARFAEAHRGGIELHQYLQWEADRQLGEAARRAGLSIGLYRDFAVGVDRSGADAWADPGMMVTGASVGAPPDLLNRKGQNWGLAPVNPVMLRRHAYAPFAAALRANMRHAGVLRIDHAMALKHVYWVPRGAGAAQGAYVSYPFEDLRRVLALESRRQRCAVIGEDLGTVPAGFRDTMRDCGVLSYRLLPFERGRGGRFLPPGDYPERAAAPFSTHDLATLKGFWLDHDLEWRRRLDLYPTPELAAKEEQERRRDRRRLLEALTEAGTLAPGAAQRLLPRDDEPVFAPELAEAVHCFLGRAKARLALLQIEDALCELEQANLPGTVDQHPNWQRKLSLSLEQALREPLLHRLAAILDEERAGKRRATAS